MSNVQECIDLYLSDAKVSDLWFRAMLRAALVSDQENDDTLSPLAEVRAQAQANTDGMVLLNRIDGARRDQIGDLEKRAKELTGFCDSLAGQVRVLRERLDNLEGK